eukprot:284347-Ditylum_brightwellii.AAC.1
MTWKGTYCSGITGNIVHRQPGTFTDHSTGLDEWEQELINKVEILVWPLGESRPSVQKRMEFSQLYAQFKDYWNSTC